MLFYIFYLVVTLCLIYWCCDCRSCLLGSFVWFGSYCLLVLRLWLDCVALTVVHAFACYLLLIVGASRLCACFIACLLIWLRWFVLLFGCFRVACGGFALVLLFCLPSLLVSVVYACYLSMFICLFGLVGLFVCSLYLFDTFVCLFWVFDCTCFGCCLLWLLVLCFLVTVVWYCLLVFDFVCGFFSDVLFTAIVSGCLF